jgi:hypothetical protein
MNERNELQEWFDMKASHSFALVGKGKTPHLSTRNDDTLCGRAVSSYFSATDYEGDVAPCGTCWKRMIAVVDAASAMLPAQYHDDNTSGEAGDMPTKNDATTEAPALNTEALVEEIEANIERVRSLAEAENAEGAEELEVETEALISKLRGATGKDTTSIRKGYRTQLAAAKRAESKEEPKATKSNEVATKQPADFTEIPGVPELVKEASAKVRELAISKFKGGHEIAAKIFEIRTHIKTEAGYIDFDATTDQAKKASSTVYDAITEKLAEEGENEADDAIRAEIGSIKKSAQNAMGDVKVLFIRALDTSADDIKAQYKYAQDAHPDKSLSEAVFTFHNITTRNTRAELAKAAREAKAALAARVAAGELTEGEAEAEAQESGLAPKEKTPTERVKAAVSKAGKAVKAVSAAEDIDIDAVADEMEDKERDALKKSIKAQIAELQKMLGALS